jgi:hypothetical protein
MANALTVTPANKQPRFIHIPQRAACGIDNGDTDLEIFII